MSTKKTIDQKIRKVLKPLRLSEVYDPLSLNLTLEDVITGELEDLFDQEVNKARINEVNRILIASEDLEYKVDGPYFFEEKYVQDRIKELEAERRDA